LIEEPELDLKIVSSRISESGPLRLGNIPIGTDLPTWS